MDVYIIKSTACLNKFIENHFVPGTVLTNVYFLKLHVI